MRRTQILMGMRLPLMVVTGDDSIFERIERDDGLYNLLSEMQAQEDGWVIEFHAGDEQNGTRIGVEKVTEEFEAVDPKNPKGTVVEVKYVSPIKYRLLCYTTVYLTLWVMAMCEGLVRWAFLTNAAVHEGVEVDQFERKLACLICYYFGTPFQYLLHDAPVIATWFSYVGFCLANLTFESFCGFFVAFWGLIYEWVKCAYFDGCIAIGKPEFAGAPPDYKSDVVKTGTTLVAVGTGVKLSAPILWATVGLADRFTLHVGALVAQKFAEMTSSAPCWLSMFDRFKRRIQFMFFLGSAKVMMPASETVLAPVQMTGNYTYTLETHSAPYEPFELEDEVWQRKAVSFWLVDEKRSTIKPIGLAGVVTGALLTNRHVFDAIEAAYACHKKVYISAVRREVKSTLGMVLYEPKEQIGPSDRNGVAFPVSSDFPLLPLPHRMQSLEVSERRKPGTNQVVLHPSLEYDWVFSEEVPLRAYKSFLPAPQFLWRLISWARLLKWPSNPPKPRTSADYITDFELVVNLLLVSQVPLPKTIGDHRNVAKVQYVDPFSDSVSALIPMKYTQAVKLLQHSIHFLERFWGLQIFPAATRCTGRLLCWMDCKTIVYIESPISCSLPDHIPITGPDELSRNYRSLYRM